MHRLVFVVVVISCGHPARPEKGPPRRLVIGHQPPFVGLVIEGTRKSTLDVMVDGTHAVERLSQKLRTQVLAVEGDAITKVATTYLAYRLDVRRGSDVQLAPELAGNTYVVTAGAEQPTVERSDGSPLAELERRTVIEDHPNLAAAGTSLAVFSGRTWEVGVPLALDPAQLAQFFSEPVTGTLILTLVDDRTATFHAEGTRTYPNGIRSETTATLVIDPHTGRLAARDGVVKLSGAWTGHSEERISNVETPAN